MMTASVASAADGIALSSWSADVGADRTVTLTIHTSGGGGLQSRFSGSNSVLGAVCRIAATGAYAFTWTPLFGHEEQVGPDTYRAGPSIMNSAPTLSCHVEALRLNGVIVQVSFTTPLPSW
jgi:hypothetical protein